MPCLRRQGLGLPLRGAQLRGMQGRKMSPREYFSLSLSVTKSWINQENNHHYDICVHWKSSSLTKCAVDAVIASIKCFCIVPIMRFSGPRSHATIPCTFTKRLNCPPLTQCPYDTLDCVVKQLSFSRIKSIILSAWESERK